jgi:excinuclease UvrABC ATPase subunit
MVLVLDVMGLGVIQYFNENRLIQDDEVSISNGAIKGWTRKKSLLLLST